MRKHETEMPLDLAAYARETAPMGPLCRGIYIALMIEYWQRGPIDPEAAQALSGATPEQWRECLPILRRLFVDAGGIWRHPRLDEARQAAEVRSQRMAKGGRKGAAIKRRSFSAEQNQARPKPSYSQARNNTNINGLQNNRERESSSFSSTKPGYSQARNSGENMELQQYRERLSSDDDEKTVPTCGKLAHDSSSGAVQMPQRIDSIEESGESLVFENDSRNVMQVIDLKAFVDKKRERERGDYRGDRDRESLESLPQELELEKDIRRSRATAKHELELDGTPETDDDRVQLVYQHWVAALGKQRSKLTGSRRRKVLARIREGYTVQELCDAIDGCARSRYHMGDNDSGKRYDDLELICRSGSKVEQFAATPSLEDQQAAKSKGRRKTASDEMWDVLADVWEPGFWQGIERGGKE